MDGGNSGRFYLFANHLGSVVAVTDSSGQLQGDLILYEPFGDYRSTPPDETNPDITDRGFTNQKHNNYIKLIDYGARWYGKEFGRFLSPDTIIPDPENPQSLNRYSYVLNRPTVATDPDGHCYPVCTIIGGAIIGASLGYGTQVYDNYQSGLSFSDALTTDIDPGPIVAGTFAGGAAGSFVGGAAAAVGAGATTTAVATTSAASSSTGISRAACADGDCTNELTSLSQQIRAFWTRSANFRGTRVYQRPDLIDPARKNPTGETSLELMQRGRAPIGPDGYSIQLHHLLQTNESSVAEVTRSFHQQFSSIIHINPNTVPSVIDRAAFGYWRELYWINRALDFIPE